MDSKMKKLCIKTNFSLFKKSWTRLDNKLSMDSIRVQLDEQMRWTLKIFLYTGFKKKKIQFEQQDFKNYYCKTELKDIWLSVDMWVSFARRQCQECFKSHPDWVIKKMIDNRNVSRRQSSIPSPGRGNGCSGQHGIAIHLHVFSKHKLHPQTHQ